MKFARSQQEAEALAKGLRDAVTCPWCRAAFAVRPGVDCGKCGGPLPLPAGPDRGPEPPPPPRVLPPRFVRQLLYTRNVNTILGIVFTVLGVVTLFALVGIAFLIPGVLMWRHGHRTSRRRLHALTHGVRAEGELRRVWMDHKETMNGSHPYRLEYAYRDEAGVTHVAVNSTYEASAGAHYVGEPMWVVHVPGAEETSSLWPPLA